MTAPVDLPPDVLRALEPPGPWLSSWPFAAALVALALLLLAAVVVVPRRRRRRTGRRQRRLRAGLAALAALAVVAAAAGSANAVTGYVPSTSDALFLLTGRQSARGGTVATVEIGAPALHVPDSTTYVYLPPGYRRDTSRRYPVVYLLHGSPGVSSDWFVAGGAARTLDALIAHHLLPPVIAVAPDTNGGGLRDTECLDDPGDGPQVETYLRSTVVPWVDAHYRTDARPAARVIAGMSAGGYCALDQGLRHRDTYGPIVAIEPFGDPGTGWQDRLPDHGAAVSPSSYLPTLPLGDPAGVALFLGTGELAGERPGVDVVERLARARGLSVLRRDVPDQGHTWTTAREDLPYGLVFAARSLPSAPS